MQSGKIHTSNRPASHSTIRVLLFAIGSVACFLLCATLGFVLDEVLLFSASAPRHLSCYVNGFGYVLGLLVGLLGPMAIIAGSFIRRHLHGRNRGALLAGALAGIFLGRYVIPAFLPSHGCDIACLLAPVVGAVVGAIFGVAAEFAATFGRVNGR